MNNQINVVRTIFSTTHTHKYWSLFLPRMAAISCMHISFSYFIIRSLCIFAFVIPLLHSVLTFNANAQQTDKCKIKHKHYDRPLIK